MTESLNQFHDDDEVNALLGSWVMENNMEVLLDHDIYERCHDFAEGFILARKLYSQN